MLSLSRYHYHMESTFLNQLEWRFATKKFAAAQPLEADKLETILKAVRLAPTSFGLQPFHVTVVTDPTVQAKLRVAAYGQPQLTESAAVLVFAARTDVLERVDDYVSRLSVGSDERRLALEPMRQMMHDSLAARTPEQRGEWAARQAYLALAFAMAAAAELGVDSCPMEGFQPKEVDAILDLPPHLNSVLLLPLGYRAEEPAHPKFRFPLDELVTRR